MGDRLVARADIESTADRFFGRIHAQLARSYIRRCISKGEELSSTSLFVAYALGGQCACRGPGRAKAWAHVGEDHEPSRQLLEQRCDGKLLLDAQDRASEQRTPTDQR